MSGGAGPGVVSVVFGLVSWGEAVAGLEVGGLGFPAVWTVRMAARSERRRVGGGAEVRVRLVKVRSWSG